MQDFFQNVSRYPRYMIALIAGIFYNALQPLVPLLKNPVTATALIGAVIATFLFLTFTLQAMLGIS
jgi:Protein of unknown function (DUF751)